MNPEQQGRVRAGRSGPARSDSFTDDGNVYFITEDADCGLITIVGTLQCSDGIAAEVSADGILISGPNARLVCGTECKEIQAPYPAPPPLTRSMSNTVLKS